MYLMLIVCLIETTCDFIGNGWRESVHSLLDTVSCRKGDQCATPLVAEIGRPRACQLIIHVKI